MIATWAGSRTKALRSASERHTDTDPMRRAPGSAHSHSPTAPSSPGHRRLSR